MYICIHTYIHAYTFVSSRYIHTFIRGVNTYIHSWGKYIHTFILEINIYIHSYLQTCIHTHIHMQYIYTYIHTFIHTSINTYVRTRMPIYKAFTLSLSLSLQPFHSAFLSRKTRAHFSTSRRNERPRVLNALNGAARRSLRRLRANEGNGRQ